MSNVEDRSKGVGPAVQVSRGAGQSAETGAATASATRSRPLGRIGSQSLD